MSDLEQEQIRNSRFYADTVAAGSGMETPANPYIVSDFDAIRSQLARIHDPTTPAKWYQDITAVGYDSFGLKQIHDKKLAFIDIFDTTTQTYTLGAGAQGVLVDASMVTNTPKTIAVGAASTSYGSVIAAAEANFTVAGTLGVGLTQTADGSGIVLNKVDIIDDATNEPPLDSSDAVFGLVQCITGTSDGAAIAASGSENLQISFAKIVAATNTLTAVTLPAGTYNFNLRRLSNFYLLPTGALISAAGALPDLIDPGAAIPRLPWREYDCPGSGIFATPNDPVNVTTGVFTTAGASTNVATYGTPALPSTGALFIADNRIKVWRNGTLQSKGVSAAVNRDVYWISSTQMAFEKRLFAGEVLSWEMPASY